MRSLLAGRHIIRQNLLSLIGICLFCYFVHPMLSGERSYIHLRTLEAQVEVMKRDYENLFAERTALERRVAMLRPGSIDPDLLEERARIVLGYSRADEKVLLDFN